MRLKTLLPILCLLGSVYTFAAPQEPASTPPPAQEAVPVAPMPSTPASSTAAPPPLPSSAEMTGSYESAFVRMLVTLLGLVFLVFATFWVLRRLGRGKFRIGSSRSVNVVERRALSPKTVLYILEVGDKKILISESQLEVRALTTLEEAPEEDNEK